MTKINPETDRSTKPFEPGDKIALEGEEWEGTTATVTNVEWQEIGWLVEITRDYDGGYDVLAWYDCHCCTMWGSKIKEEA